MPSLRHACLEAGPRRAELFSHQARRGAARLAPCGGRAAHGDARVGIPVLRRAEPATAHRAALVALRLRRGGDALDLVRAADARAAHPHLLPPDGGRRRGRRVRLPHLHRPERRRMVPRPRPAHPRLGVRAGVPFELSAARRAAVAALCDRHVHRHRGPDGAGRGILHGPLFPRGVAADVVARRGGHLHRAHHPAARRAPRALAARGGPPTLQYVKKGGHGARHAFPFLPCVDRKDAFKALKVKNLLFFKLSNGTHILSHTSIKLFA